jgi:mannose-1-phosphate guanylyltransferase
MSGAPPSRLHGVILAGGSGTRLWPLSTKDHPKQFLSIGADRSLLTQTAERLRPMVSMENLWLVCGKKHAAAAVRHLPGFSKERILEEPMARNTAPAIAWAAFRLRAVDPDALMVVLPADHLILPEDWEKFLDDVRLAAQVAGERKALLTFGIPPNHPATGFGYLEQGEEFRAEGKDYFRVKAFHEKPDQNTAETYLRRGGYYWNSGMFLWEVKTFLAELERCQPAMHAAFAELSRSQGSPSYPDRLTRTFQEMENISVDYAVMERAENVFMVPASFSWDDVGNLAAFAKILPSDGQGNRSQGECFAVDSRNNLTISRTKPIALVGVSELVVVEGERAVLVLSREKVQEVKKMVEYLRDIGREDLL